MGKNILSLASIEHILKDSGAPRVSEDAKNALRDIVEEYGLQIAESAVKFAKHSGRKTIKASDIRLAFQ